MLLKFKISLIIIFVASGYIFSQKNDDCLINEIQLKNLTDSSLYTGFYEIMKMSYIEIEEYDNKVEYKQEVKKIKYSKKVLFFKRKKEAVLVRNIPKITSKYSEKAFEKVLNENEEYKYKLNTRPILINRHIDSINIVSYNDSLSTLKIKFNKKGNTIMNKFSEEGLKDIGLVVNNKLIKFISISDINKSFNGYPSYNFNHFELQFSNCTKEEIENVKKDLLKN